MTTIDRLLVESVQVILRNRTGAEDDFGTPTIEDADPVLERWHFQPASSEEYEGPATGEVTWVGYGPADSVIDASAKVVFATSRELEIVGPPRVWTNPRTGFESHIVAGFVEPS